MSITIKDEVATEFLPENPNELIEAQQRSDAVGEALQQINEQVQEDAERVEANKPQGPPLERLNGIEFEFGDKVIRMEIPGKPTEIYMNRILGEMRLPGMADEANAASMLMILQNRQFEITAVLYVTKINGEPVSTPTNLNEYLVLINKLGELGLQAVHQKYMDHFRPPGREEVKTLKKW